MAEKQKIVQNEDGSTTIYVKPDIIGIVGEIVGCIGGIACGGLVGINVAKMIGPVSTTIEKVGKAVVVGAASTATEYYVSEGIAGTFNEISDITDGVMEKFNDRTQKAIEAEESKEVKNKK